MKYFVSILISFNFIFCLGEENKTIDSLENLLSTVSEDTTKVNLLNRLSENYLTINFAKALEKAMQAKEHAEKTGFRKGSAKSLSQAGLAYYFQGKYDRALQSYIEAMKIYESIADKGGIAITLNDIGNVYRKNGDSKNALESFLKAEKIYSEINDKRGIAICYDNTGVVFSEMKDYDRALEYFLKSLAIDREMGFKADIPYSLIYAAGIYSIKGQYEKAEEFYAESLQIREELNDKSGIAINLNDMGELNLMKKNFPKAVEYFESALKISLEIKFKDLTRHIYQMLSETFAMQNKFAEAYRYNNLSSSIKDEIFNEQKSKQMAEMQTKYETEKKEKEIEIQNLKIQDQQMKLNQRNVFIIILFAGLIMITAIALLIYRQEKLKQKQITDKALIEQQEHRIRAIIEGEEKERRRLAQELHDGLGQMLSTVKLNISGLEGNIINQKEKQLNLSLSLLDESCNELRNISHNLMPSALIKLGLVPALKEFTDKINHSGTLKIHLQTHGIHDRLNNSVETGLYRIIQELLNNIIKYAKAKNVTLQLIKDENQLTTMIEDDGVGFDIKSMEHSDGIGWKNIKSRVQFLNGNFDIDSHPGRGTTVTVDIPVSPNPTSIKGGKRIIVKLIETRFNLFLMKNLFLFIILHLLLFTFSPGYIFSQNADIDLLRDINKNSSPFMDKVFPVITESATPVTIAVPLSLFITGLATKNDSLKKKSYRIGASLLIANAIAGGLKYSINRPRPFNTYPFIVKKSSGGSPSFPSGHTTTAFSTAMSLSLAYPKWYIIAPAYLWACSVGYSRMYLGVHYPSDVLAGIIIGTGFSYLSFKGQQWLEKRKKQNTMIEYRIMYSR